jgi:hypothetical protein
MSNLSLEKSIRTCKVSTGWADRIQSDRFLNPNQMVCIPWNGFDNQGRSVCPDSFMTKSLGCNSADDRVTVENSLRPEYMSYIALNAGGIEGHIYGNTEAHTNLLAHNANMANNNTRTGNFGSQFGANTRFNGCTTNAYERNMAQVAQTDRQRMALQNGYEGYSNSKCAGF